MTVEKAEAEGDNKDESGNVIVEEQAIFWECKFDTVAELADTSATCNKAKVAKTKHDGDRAKECFATKFGGLVSAILVLTGLMN